MTHQISHYHDHRHVAGRESLFSRLGTRLTRCWPFAAKQPRKVRLVQVWDERSGMYRQVNLHDSSDPLWATAIAVAQCRKSRRAAA